MHYHNCLPNTKVKEIWYLKCADWKFCQHLANSDIIVLKTNFIIVSSQPVSQKCLSLCFPSIALKTKQGKFTVIVESDKKYMKGYIHEEM